MKGKIKYISENNYGLLYGKIEYNYERYYFDSRSLSAECGKGMNDYQAGDCVEFEAGMNDLGLQAQNVKMVDRNEGYITAFYPAKQFGFIDKKYFFNKLMLIEDVDLDVTLYRYKVSYQVMPSMEKKDGYIADNIRIEEVLPMNKGNSTEDINDISRQRLVKSVEAFSDGLSKSSVSPEHQKIFSILYSNFENHAKISGVEMGILLKKYGVFYSVKLGELCKSLTDFIGNIEYVDVDNNGILQIYMEFFYDDVTKEKYLIEVETLNCSSSINELKSKVFCVLYERYPNSSEFNLSDLGKLLKTEGITYPGKLVDLCKKYGEFLSIDYKIVNDTPQAFLTFEYDEQVKNKYAIYESGSIDDVEEGETEEDKETENGMTGTVNSAIKLVGEKEKKIIRFFSRIFKITVLKRNDAFGGRYYYCLLKPNSLFGEQFNIKHEIVMVLSPYKYADPRPMDIIGITTNEYVKKSPQRLERIASILVCDDSEIGMKIREQSKNLTQQMSMVIPFSYEEILKNEDTNDLDKQEMIINRFRAFFFDKDFFVASGKITTDLFFFGRQAFVQELVDSHKSGENCGVFGLRRSGKTSILYAVQRLLDTQDMKWVYIDFEGKGSFRWFQLLQSIVKQCYDVVGGDYSENEKKEYTEEDASKQFEEELNELFRQNDTSILLMIDEIERITFDISMDSHWKDGGDFIRFWEVVRSYYNQYHSRITFIVAGTNPKAAEESKIGIGSFDNPLYGQLNVRYLPSFSVEETGEMLNKLGGFMGLKFDQEVAYEMTKDFGGQPYVMRLMGSLIYKSVIESNEERPKRISKLYYMKSRDAFKNSNDLYNYYELIMNVLQTNYPKEFGFLESLAIGDKEEIEDRKKTRNITQHLIGYGLIESEAGEFGFKNDTLKNFILELGENELKKKYETDEERWQIISKYRGKVENKMFGLIQIALKMRYGETEAKNKVLAEKKHKLNPQKYSQACNLTYAELFDQNKVERYWSEMVDTITHNWDAFEKLFSDTDEKTFTAMGCVINVLRADAHAKSISQETLDCFVSCIKWFQKEIDNTGF